MVVLDTYLTYKKLHYNLWLTDTLAMAKKAKFGLVTAPRQRPRKRPGRHKKSPNKHEKRMGKFRRK